MTKLHGAIILGLGTLLSVLAAGFAADGLFRAHALIVMVVLGIATIYMLRQVDFSQPTAKVDEESAYMDGPIRVGSILTVFWGVVGFLVGVVVALQLAFPDIFNIQPWFNFGRLRPLHTSAVIFAFGGTALITTSFYVVQRTSRARLWGGELAWFVFWGYQLFIVMAATAICSASPKGANMPNPNGMSICG